MLRFLPVIIFSWVMSISISLAEEPPKGELIKYTFNQSKIFPGTTREVSIYVPAQYQADQPACLYVGQDGVGYNAPKYFDSLIHNKEMPVTIGVFITPGVVPATNPNALNRFNRSYEYDGLGDNYVRMLLDEILPDVETKTTKDGRKLVLSKSGNDRAIAGNSSGGVCAFTAAWERPDAFSRVFTGVGTYVGLRGADEYPTLVRKFEPKPLRIFLQDGSNDLNIYAGDWWMANQMMERALTFSGYEVNHAWGTGGHNSKDAEAVFIEAMKWLWKDWPQPISQGHGSPQLQEILIPGEAWKLVGEGYKASEGPAVNSHGEFYFNDVPNHKTFKLDADHKPLEFLSIENRRDGQRFGTGDKLISVASATEQIVSYDATGKEKILADGFKGNDLVALHNGGIYVTNPGWDGKSPSQIWYLSPQGEKRVVDQGLKFSNGITTSPDQTLLYVADSRSHWVYSYQIQENGDLKYKQKFYHMHMPDSADDAGSDGLRVDQNGRLYVATRMGIQVCDQAGRVNCIIPTPNKKVSNLEFGGKDFNILYATCGDKVYMRNVKVKGYSSWMAPLKPEKPKL